MLSLLQHSTFTWFDKLLVGVELIKNYITVFNGFSVILTSSHMYLRDKNIVAGLPSDVIKMSLSDTM